MSIRITVITGSPHKNGATALLADRFVEGAKEAGHEIFRFNAAFVNVNPCLGCDYCRISGRQCVYKDDMSELNPELLKADLVMFVTPLYYFGISAQLKKVIDRFYASNRKLMGSGKKAMLMVASHDSNERAMKDIVSHYQMIVKYLKWSDTGILLATGVGTGRNTKLTNYLKNAYKIGRYVK